MNVFRSMTGGIAMSLFLSATANAAIGHHEQHKPTRMEARTRSLVDQQIDKLEQLVAMSDSSDGDLPDVLFLLADRLAEKRIDAERRAAAAEAKQAGRRAAAVYRMLVSDRAFADYSRMDEALHLYAIELAALGREDEKLSIDQRLIRDFPRSEYVAYALQDFADYNVEEGRMADALAFYQRIVDEHRSSPLYARALHQLAWCSSAVDMSGAPFGESLEQFVDASTAIAIAGE